MIDYSTEVFRSHTAEAVDQIDAALFSGDEFLSLAARVALRRMFKRWSERLAELTGEDMHAHGMPAEEDDAHGQDDDSSLSGGKIVLG
jgi:hypothetical protein